MSLWVTKLDFTKLTLPCCLVMKLLLPIHKFPEWKTNIIHNKTSVCLRMKYLKKYFEIIKHEDASFSFFSRWNSERDLSTFLPTQYNVFLTWKLTWGSPGIWGSWRLKYNCVNQKINFITLKTQTLLCSIGAANFRMLQWFYKNKYIIFDRQSWADGERNGHNWRFLTSNEGSFSVLLIIL